MYIGGVCAAVFQLPRFRWPSLLSPISPSPPSPPSSAVFKSSFASSLPLDAAVASVVRECACLRSCRHALCSKDRLAVQGDLGLSRQRLARPASIAGSAQLYGNTTHTDRSKSAVL